jgi:hypothetical protein
MDRFRVVAKCQSSLIPAWDKPSAQLSGIRGILLTDIPEIALVDSSREVWFLDLMPLRALHERGALDDKPLIDALAGHKIAAVALDAGLLRRNWRGRDLFWPELREAIDRNYGIASVGDFYLAVPRQNAK